MITNTSKKCYKCHKSSLILFKCKCDFDYCTNHRLPEKHSCTNMSDFANRDQLSKSLIKIENNRIETI